MKLDSDIVLDSMGEAGLDEDAMYEDYSGRAMFGDTCFGIVCGLNEFIHFITDYVSAGGDDSDLSWLRNVRCDSMGLSTIWYWPGVTVE